MSRGLGDVYKRQSTHFVLKKYKDYGTIIEDEAKDERMLITP